MSKVTIRASEAGNQLRATSEESDINPKPGFSLEVSP